SPGCGKKPLQNGDRTPKSKSPVPVLQRLLNGRQRDHAFAIEAVRAGDQRGQAPSNPGACPPVVRTSYFFSFFSLSISFSSLSTFLRSFRSLRLSRLSLRLSRLSLRLSRLSLRLSRLSLRLSFLSFLSCLAASTLLTFATAELRGRPAKRP